MEHDVRHAAAGAPEAPRVSVCIANYEGETLLGDCIASVLAQDVAGGIEIIVHDDASTDASVELLRREFPQVEVLASAVNVGFCVANNRMAEVARGTFLLLLNNDAALLPGALRALADAASQEAGIYTIPQYDWDSGALVDRGCLLDPFGNPVPNLDPERRDVAMVIGACLFLPTALWRQLGGFPEWMDSIAEDLYLCGRVRLRGKPVRAVGASGYRHRQGHSFGGNRLEGTRLSSTYRRRALSERNKTFALAILTPGALALPLLAAHLVLLGLEGLALCALRRSGEPWRRIYGPAIAATLRERGRLHRHRRDEQAARTISLAGWLATTRWLPRKLELLVRHGVPGLR